MDKNDDLLKYWNNLVRDGGLIYIGQEDFIKTVTLHETFQTAKLWNSESWDIEDEK